MLIGTLGVLVHGERVPRTATLSAHLPPAWYQILSLVTGTDLEIQAVTGGGAVVSGVGDRHASWELCLASEATAKKRIALSRCRSPSARSAPFA